LDVDGFYFIRDEYFVDFPDDKLMTNKEVINGQAHNRPCYYAFEDDVTGLYWLIPISSQISKFEAIYNSKIEKYRICDTIVFAYVLGDKKAFLIQNMCPVTDEYINNQYINSCTGDPVIINPKAAHEIKNKAKKILMLYRKKGINLILPNVFEIEKKLLLKQNSSQVASTKSIT
jgi:hypothetical protein